MNDIALGKTHTRSDTHQSIEFTIKVFPSVVGKRNIHKSRNMFHDATEQLPRKVLFAPKNVNTAWFDSQTKKLEPHCITKQTAPHESTVQ